MPEGSAFSWRGMRVEHNQRERSCAFRNIDNFEGRAECGAFAGIPGGERAFSQHTQNFESKIDYIIYTLNYGSILKQDNTVDAI